MKARYNRRGLLVAAACMLAVLVGAATSFAGDSDTTVEDVTAAGVPGVGGVHAPRIEGLDEATTDYFARNMLEVSVGTAPAKIDETRAIDIVRKTRAGSRASSVTALQIVVTDPTTATVDRPMWLVSAQGLTIRRHGHPNWPSLSEEERVLTSGDTHHELTFLIDAETGQARSEFSYR